MDGEHSEHKETLNQLKQSIKNAIELYPKIDLSSTDHFPFEIANTKVLRIKELVIDKDVTWDDLYFESLDVGLQAAKSIDLLNYQGVQKEYIIQLHTIAYLVLKIYYKLPIIRGDLLTAYRFYKQHGYELEKIFSHLRGINFKNVVKISNLYSEENLYQYQKKCAKKNRQLNNLRVIITLHYRKYILHYSALITFFNARGVVI